MSEYTPTTAEVRAAWSAWYEPGDDRWAPERFDRWLAAHDAELAALLDERDAQNGAISTLSHTLSEQQQDIEKRDQRIRDLEAEVERLRALSAHWLDVVSAPTFESAVDAEARHYHDSACTYQVERDKLTAKLDAVKAYVSRLSISSDHPMEAWHRAQLLAILADTDEGKDSITFNTDDLGPATDIDGNPLADTDEGRRA